MPYTNIGAIGEIELADNAASENKANIMTLNNVIMFGGDVVLVDYHANDTFATLSEDTLYPSSPVKVPCVVTSENTDRIAVLTVNDDGTMALPFDYESATVHLSSVLVSTNNKWYTPEIGNIYNNGTSPLTDSL